MHFYHKGLNIASINKIYSAMLIPMTKLIIDGAFQFDISDAAQRALLHVCLLRICQ
jgi:hypothetical protein